MEERQAGRWYQNAASRVVPSMRMARHDGDVGLGIARAPVVSSVIRSVGYITRAMRSWRSSSGSAAPIEVSDSEPAPGSERQEIDRTAPACGTGRAIRITPTGSGARS